MRLLAAGAASLGALYYLYRCRVLFVFVLCVASFVLHLHVLPLHYLRTLAQYLHSLNFIIPGAAMPAYYVRPMHITWEGLCILLVLVWTCLCAAMRSSVQEAAPHRLALAQGALRLMMHRTQTCMHPSRLGLLWTATEAMRRAATSRQVHRVRWS